MQIAKSKKVEDVSLVEEKEHEMSKELNELRLRESVMKGHLHSENKKLREQLQEKKGTTCHHGKFVRGSHTMQKTIQVLCHFPQGAVTKILDKNISTIWLSTSTRLQKVH